MSVELEAYRSRVIDVLHQLADHEAGLFGRAEARGDEDGQDLHLYAEQALRHAADEVGDLTRE